MRPRIQQEAGKPGQGRLSRKVYRFVRIGVMVVELPSGCVYIAREVKIEFGSLNDPRPPDRQMKDRHACNYADFAALWKYAPAHAVLRRLDLLEQVRLHKSRFLSSSWASYATVVPGSLRLVPSAAQIEIMVAILEEAEAVLNRS